MPPSHSATRLLIFLARVVDPTTSSGHIDAIAKESIRATLDNASIYLSEPDGAEESSPKVIGLFCSTAETAISPPLEALTRSLEKLLNRSVECRIYEPMVDNSKPFRTVEHGPHILVLNAMTPGPGADRVFNEWYSDEHIPMLRLTPSWLSSKRYILSASTGPAPSYLALHAWSSRSVFDSMEYKAATDTPWRTEVIGRVAETERIAFSYVGELEDSELKRSQD